MKPISILLYTDWSFINANPESPWSVSYLLRFAALKSSPLAKVSFTILSRHSASGINRLSAALLEGLDQLWVFGFIDDTTPPFGLNDQELGDLADWMDRGGGVLITGDHSITRSPDQCKADHRTFLGRGRALGSRIRRAGQLRVWEGPPTACDDAPLELRDNYNTQEGDDPNALDSPTLQSDSRAQTLVEGPIAHPLFFWHCDNGHRVPITKFPDHAHEGKLARLNTLNEEWPKGSPLPLVVAWGRDKRFACEPRFYDLVSAYDGDVADGEVGRIVADTSFHHYLNMNLVGLNGVDCCGNPIAGSDLDQIAQYYGNLVIWLSPKPVRRKIKLGLITRAIVHPEVLELWGASMRQLSEAAIYVLQKEVGISNISRLFFHSTQTDETDGLDQFLRWMFLQTTRNRFAPVEPHQVVGATIKAFHNWLDENNIHDPGLVNELPGPEYLLLNGLTLAREQGIPGIDKLSEEVRPLLL